MKRFLFMVTALTMLTSCATTTSSNKVSVEMEDLSYITSQAASEMNNCLDNDDKNACEEADRLLTKYPWLITRDMNISNMRGMRQNEWDTQVRTIRKNLDIIENRYSTFYIKKQNL